MAHGPIPDKPVGMEEFLAESLKLKDGRDFRPTETPQLRFIREAAASGQRLQREDAAALTTHIPSL
jgi:hypothetical protein